MRRDPLGHGIGPVRLIAPLLSAALAAAPAGAETRDWPLKGFEKVQLEAVADLVVTAGSGFRVHADGDPELVQRLTADVDGGTLFLRFAKGQWGSMHDRKLRIEVTMPHVAGAGLKGVGAITVDRAEAPLVVFAVDGTGSVDVKAIRADKTVLSLAGTGSIEVAGTTGHLDARRSGIGSIEAGKLVARSATLVSTGLGSLDAQVDGPVDITKSGLGSVSVAGHPACTIRKSGMGSVDCTGRSDGE